MHGPVCQPRVLVGGRTAGRPPVGGRNTGGWGAGSQGSVKEPGGGGEDQKGVEASPLKAETVGKRVDVARWWEEEPASLPVSLHRRDIGKKDQGARTPFSPT